MEKLVDRYTAHVRMHEAGKLIKLDQEDLETVIPQAGGEPNPNPHPHPNPSPNPSYGCIWSSTA